jgi:membrane protease subunit HflK
VIGRKERTLFVAVGITLGLVGLRFLLADWSGSLAVRASAWHSVSDLVPPLLALAGVWLARWHGRAHSVSLFENAAALVIAGSIFLVGIGIVREVVFGESQPLEALPLVTVLALASAGVSYVLARLQTVVGEAEGSPGLVASGAHARVDMYAALVVVAGLLGYGAGFRTLDRVVAALLALAIFLNGLEILGGALQGLRSGGLFALEGAHAGLPGGVAHEWRRWRSRLVPLAAVLYVLSGVVVLQPHEAGIVQRFGRPVGAPLGPGLHVRWPWPVERVERVDLATARRLAIPTSFMLTGDESLLEVGGQVHYRVRDPLAFAYRLAAPDDLVRAAAEGAVRELVNARPVDRLLAEDRGALQIAARGEAQRLLDRDGTGVEVTALELTKVDPPPDVLEAFRDLASAREDRATFVNEALAYQSEVVPQARGEAEKRLQAAEAFREERVRRARGEATAFVEKLRAYQSARDVTRVRLYLETLERVLPGVQTLIVDPRLKVEQTDLWLYPGDTDTIARPDTVPPPGGKRQ